MLRQVKIKDLENDMITGGIMLDNGDVICGCCGSLFPADEIDETYEIFVYEYWEDISDTILEGRC